MDNIIGNRIKQLRVSAGMKQQELINALRDRYSIDTSRITISRWENGKQIPETYNLRCIAELFGVSLDYLFGRSDHLREVNGVILSDEVEVSEIAQVAAGFDKAPLSNFEYDKFAVPRSYLAGHDVSECFIVRVKGDSMYPLYIDGDRVLSRRSDVLDYSGQIGIVQDGETATIKKIEFGSGWLRLVPINPAYAPRTIKGIDLEQVRIIGIPMVLLRELEAE